MLLFFCGTRFPERAQPFRWTYRSHENGNVVTMAHRWQALPFMGFIQQQRRNTPDKRARCGADKKAGKRLPLVAQSRGVAKATQRQQVRINALFHFVDNLSFGIFCCSWISSFMDGSSCILYKSLYFSSYIHILPLFDWQLSSVKLPIASIMMAASKLCKRWTGSFELPLTASHCQMA